VEVIFCRSSMSWFLWTSDLSISYLQSFITLVEVPDVTAGCKVKLRDIVLVLY